MPTEQELNGYLIKSQIRRRQNIRERNYERSKSKKKEIVDSYRFCFDRNNNHFSVRFTDIGKSIRIERNGKKTGRDKSWKTVMPR